MKILLHALIIVFLILFPSDTADTARKAMTLWATSIVPMLFPYMVFSRFLCEVLDTIRFPIVPLTAALGILGGSPSGAVIICANQSAFSQRKLFTLCAFCGTISPMFILGSMQSWINQPAICRRLLLIHWFSAAACAWIVWLLNHSYQETLSLKTSKTSVNHSDPIRQSVDAVFQIGGCIILYSVLAGMFGKILRPFPILQPLVHAVLEVSGGIHAICESTFSPETHCILLSASLGFSGFSILSQNHAMLKPLGISMRRLTVYAVLRAGISAILMILLNVCFPLT